MLSRRRGIHLGLNNVIGFGFRFLIINTLCYRVMVFWYLSIYSNSGVYGCPRIFVIERTDIFVKMFFEKMMTQIFYPKICSKYLQNKICRYYAKRLEKQEGGLSESWFFVWWGFLASWEKKLKIATFTEAPFMVKSDFWNYKYSSSNICAIIPG